MSLREVNWSTALYIVISPFAAIAAAVYDVGFYLSDATSGILYVVGDRPEHHGRLSSLRR